MVRQQEGGFKYIECMGLLGGMHTLSGKDM